MKNVGLIAFGTFGSPNGFTQSVFTNNYGLDKEIKEFDLDSNAIELLPSTEIYAIRREKIGISYALYTYAKEKKSDRNGSFIGSALVFKNWHIVNENLTIQVLNDFHTKLISSNLDNNKRLRVLHSKELDVSAPEDFDKLEYNLKEIPKINSVFRKKTLLVFSSTAPQDLQNHFQTALYLLEKYDTILFTKDIKVAEFTQKRGLYDVLDREGFQKEKEKIEEEKRKRVQSFIFKYQRELENTDKEQEEELKIYKNKIEKTQKLIENIEKEQKEKLKIYKNKIEEAQKLIENIEKEQKEELKIYKNKQEENQKLIKKLENTIHKIKEQYESFKDLIRNSINHLENKKPIEEVEKKFREDKETLNNNLRQISGSVSINKNVNQSPTINQHSHQNSSDVSWKRQDDKNNNLRQISDSVPINRNVNQPYIINESSYPYFEDATRKRQDDENNGLINRIINFFRKIF